MESRTTRSVLPALLAACCLAACGGAAKKAEPPPPTAVAAPVAERPALTEEPDEAAPAAAQAVDCPSASAPAPKAQQNIICFPPGKVAVDAADKRLLQRHADRLKQNRRLVVTLVAFTDSQGSPNFGLALTGRWLRSVADTLAAFGVPRHQVRKDAYPRPRDSVACPSGNCPPGTPRVELRYRK